MNPRFFAPLNWKRPTCWRCGSKGGGNSNTPCWASEYPTTSSTHYVLLITPSIGKNLTYSKCRFTGLVPRNSKKQEMHVGWCWRGKLMRARVMEEDFNLGPAPKERASNTNPATAPDLDKEFLLHDRTAIPAAIIAATSGCQSTMLLLSSIACMSGRNLPRVSNPIALTNVLTCSAECPS